MNHRLPTATPVRPGSPSSRAPRCSTPNSHTIRSWPSWSISAKVAAFGRPHAWWGSTRIPSHAWPCWPVSTPKPPTTSWWPFPPNTREVQFDEKWSFVFKKQKNCDPTNPDDDHCGDYWDHVAFDPEHKLVLGVIPGGARVEENGLRLSPVKRAGGRDSPPPLMTSPDSTRTRRRSRTLFSELARSRHNAKPGRPRVSALIAGCWTTWSTRLVAKERENNRVTYRGPGGKSSARGRPWRTFLAESAVSQRVNTLFVEDATTAPTGPQRRKARKTYRFSKGLADP